MRRFLKFVFFLTAILGIVGFYLGNRINNWLGIAGGWNAVTYVIIGLIVIFQISSFIGYRVFYKYFDPDNSAIYNLISYSVLGIFASFFIYTLTVDIAMIIGALFFGLYDHTKTAFWIVCWATTISAAIGALQTIFGPKIYRVTVKIKNLPESFDGFKIAQISDLHIGPVAGKKYCQKVVDITNRLNADMITLTGDMIDGTTDRIREKISPIANLEAKDGVYFVPGNHEYYWDGPAWIVEFSRLGATCLVNQNILLSKNDQQILIAGISDYMAGHLVLNHSPNVKKAAISNHKTTKILLSHQPKSFKEAEAAGFDLQLSGHTHGGQFFPWNLIVAMAQPHYKGLGKYKNLQIYTNRGTGFWGPPFRFGVPSEITLITLRKE